MSIIWSSTLPLVLKTKQFHQLQFIVKTVKICMDALEELNIKVRTHHIINSYSLNTGGAERLVRRLHRGLLGLGRECRLVQLGSGSVSRLDGGSVNQLDGESVSQLDGESVSQLDGRSVSWLDGESVNQLDSGVEDSMVSFGLESSYCWSALKSVLEYIRKEVREGDIVHAHLSPTIFYCALAKRISRKRFYLIVTEHNSHNNRRGKLKGKLLDSFLYHSVDHVACISRGARNALIRWMPLTEKKSNVIYNGIPLYFDVIPKRLQRDTIRIVSVGRLHKQKNIANALRAFAIVKSNYVSEAVNQKIGESVSRSDSQTVRRSSSETVRHLAGKSVGQKVGELVKQVDSESINASPRHSTFDPRPHVEYCIAGSGDLEDELKSLARELGIDEHVTFLGHIQDIPRLLAEADIFLIPSLWEGFGLAALEAMNAGLPVIASDVDGLKELIVAGRKSKVEGSQGARSEEGRGSKIESQKRSRVESRGSSGILVDPNDPANIAQAIKRLIESPKLRQELGQNGFKRVGDFSEDRMIEGYQKLYETVNR